MTDRSPARSTRRAPRGGPPSPTSAAVKHESQKAWESATRNIVEEERRRANELKKKMLSLEQAEAERVAAQLAERERQALLRAREEKRRREAERIAAEEKVRKAQAEDMKRAHKEMEQAKKDEAQALKAATANYHKAIQAENEALEIAERMKSMNDAMQKLGNAISKCQHEARMKFSAILVCERRLAMREEKPESEAFRDKVHEALEEEAEVLTKSRRELQEWVAAGAAIKVDIQRTQLLLTTGPSRENVARRLQSSASLPAIEERLQRTPTHQDLVRDSHELVDKATKLTHDSMECLFRTHGECDRASARVSECFDQRNAKTVALRKNIEAQRKELTATIADTSRRLALLKMRSHRTPETPENAEITRQQVEAAEALMVELKRGKRRLEEDYRLKTSSFRIDRSCRGLTKVRAGTHSSKLAPLSPSGTQSSPAL